MRLTKKVKVSYRKQGAPSAVHVQYVKLSFMG